MSISLANRPPLNTRRVVVSDGNLLVTPLDLDKEESVVLAHFHLPEDHPC